MTFRDIIKRMTLGDKILIVALSLLTGASFPLLNAWSAAGDWVVIEVNGSRMLKAPLQRDESYAVKGYLYDTVVEVRDGTAEINDSSCPSPMLHSGKISRTGDFRVCVYNRTVIRILGESSLGVDAVTK